MDSNIQNAERSNQSIARASQRAKAGVCLGGRGASILELTEILIIQEFGWFCRLQPTRSLRLEENAKSPLILPAMSIARLFITDRGPARKRKRDVDASHG
jgi:hypothetical protein